MRATASARRCRPLSRRSGLRPDVYCRLCQVIPHPAKSPLSMAPGSGPGRRTEMIFPANRICPEIPVTDFTTDCDTTQSRPVRHLGSELNSQAHTGLRFTTSTGINLYDAVKADPRLPLPATPEFPPAHPGSDRHRPPGDGSMSDRRGGLAFPFSQRAQHCFVSRHRSSPPDRI